MTIKREKAVDEQFCSSCGELIKYAAEFCVHCGVRQNPVGTYGGSSPSYYGITPPAYQQAGQIQPYVNGRDKWIAVILTFFLGGIGVHKFYLGKPVQGIFCLLFFWTFIPSIIAIVEFLIYLFTPEDQFRARYRYRS